MKKPRISNREKQVSAETRNVLDSAITNLVQALGSKASVLIFWDWQRNEPSQFSTYGLSAAAFKELQPTLEEVTQNLGERAAGGNEELTAIQAEVTVQSRNMLLVALPIQAEGRFIAALCLLQPLIPHGEAGEVTTPAVAALPGTGRGDYIDTSEREKQDWRWIPQV